MILLMLACGSGPSAESLIPDLRVIGAVAEPPEVGPTESTTLTVILGDPAEEGAEILVWTCLPDGSDGCLESRGAPSTWATIATDGVAELSAPSAAAQLVSSERPLLPVPLYTLACAPGVCGIFDEVRADPQPGTPAYTALTEALANPIELLTELPFEGVALATQSLIVTSLPPEQRNQNPTLSLRNTEPITATTALDDSVALDLEIEDADDVTVYGFSTLGGFGPASVDAFAGAASLDWFPGPDAQAGDAGTVWMVAVDVRGGSAVWQGSVEVTAP